MNKRFFWFNAKTSGSELIDWLIDLIYDDKVPFRSYRLHFFAERPEPGTHCRPVVGGARDWSRSIQPIEASDAQSEKEWVAEHNSATWCPIHCI